MKISVVIPAHNEERIIERTLTSVSQALDNHKVDYEIIAVDDNSNDNTLELMKEVARLNERIKPVYKGSRKPGPTGEGSALMFGFNHSMGDIIVSFLGDLSEDPEDIPKLLRKMDENYDLVCGSRFIEGGKVKNYPAIKLLMNRLWNRGFAFLFGLNIRDISNAFKAYKREVIESVKPRSPGFEFPAETVLKAHLQGFRICEVPVSWRGREKAEGISKFTFVKTPRIGYYYILMGLRLWFKLLLKRIASGW